MRSRPLPLRWWFPLLIAGGCECGDEGIRAQRPDIVARPSPLGFGEVFVGEEATRTLTLGNLGDGRLSVSGAEVEAGSSPGLAVTSSATFELAPGAERELTVRFRPTALGPATGAIVVRSDDPDQPALRVPIEGAGARRPGPRIEVCVESLELGLARRCEDPLAVDFGTTPVGATRSATITIRSVGTVALDVSSAELQPATDPAFSATPSQASGALDPEDGRTVVVRFAPSAEGVLGGSYAVISDDEERDWVPIAFVGQAVAPALCVTPDALDFSRVGVGSTKTLTLTLESCGSAELVLARASTRGGSPDFSVGALASTRLPPGATTTLDVEYAPSGPGRDFDELILEANLPGPVVVPMVGSAGGCDLDVGSRSISFGTLAQGSATRSVLLTNLGSADCTISAIAFRAGTTPELAIGQAPRIPAVVPSGGTASVVLAYTPTDSGSDAGTLEITSDDPDEPVIAISVTGRRLGLGDCELSARPNPLSFGPVRVGASRQGSIEVTNIGSKTCWVTDVQIAVNSDRGFRLVPPRIVPMVIPVGQSETFEIFFEPLTMGPANAELELYADLLSMGTPTHAFPITGAGTGPKLCVQPSPVPFGTRAIGTRSEVTVSLYACGTEAVDVQRLALAAGTSTEFSIVTAPTLPLSLAAGARADVVLAYVGRDAGRDVGELEVRSTDLLAPNQVVELVGATGDGPCGDLVGKICGLDGKGPVAGATVYVATSSIGRVSAETNAAGDYVLSCVPPGTHLVGVEAGSWSTSFTANVTSDQVSFVPGQECLRPDSANVAVVYGRWDTIQDILAFMSIPATVYGDTSGRSVADLLLDPTELALYDIVFLNCGYDESIVLDGPGIQNLRDFVNNGGSLYASDWAYDALEQAWPGAIDFYGDDAVIDAGQSAGNFAGLVDVLEPQLVRVLGGKTQVQIESCCSAVDGAGPGTSVYLAGDRLNDGGSHPLMVSFQPQIGAGYVYYTDFHNTGQADIYDVFRWLITRL